jgi:hypothetical protein
MHRDDAKRQQRSAKNLIIITWNKRLLRFACLLT